MLSQGSVIVPSITGLQCEMGRQESSVKSPVFHARAEVISSENEIHITDKAYLEMAKLGE